MISSWKWQNRKFVDNWAHLSIYTRKIPISFNFKSKEKFNIGKLWRKMKIHFRNNFRCFLLSWLEWWSKETSKNSIFSRSDQRWEIFHNFPTSIYHEISSISPRRRIRTWKIFVSRQTNKSSEIAEPYRNSNQNMVSESQVSLPFLQKNLSPPNLKQSVFAELSSRGNIQQKLKVWHHTTTHL